ncbi:MAG TPA: SDR family oxidoreductase [Hyphomicrobiaceae bacterium]|nr:SDR family oxidoreductase [Hyphomicrobiaceae bacterium]
MLTWLADAWRRRWWREDRVALAAYAGLRPMTVVTGASEGIGYALARRFAAAGHDLIMIARRPELLEAAATRIRAEHRVEAVTVAVDIASPEAIGNIEAVLARHRAYADVLVNNAGIGLAGPFVSHSPEEIERLLATNLRALTRLMRHFLPGMRVRGRGGILNLASIGSYTPGPYQAVYYASKAYVLSLSEAVAVETAGEGVRITAVTPGPVSTNFHKRMGAERSLYRYFVAPSSPESVALASYLGFVLGLRLVVPGILNPFTALAVRILPHRIVVPIVGWLLKPRGTEGRDAGR